ncbi:hypothetical protein [Rhizobium sp. No.120]
MSSTSVLSDIPGGKTLLEWFGRLPRFHDAKLLEISFPGSGAGLMRIHAWNMTDQVDAKGYFLLDKHAIVTLVLEEVSAISCADFEMVPGTIFDLEIARMDENFRIEWDASYGVSGFVIAKHIKISLVPTDSV